MINFQAFLHLAQTELDPPAPKPTAIAGNPQEASKALWSSDDGRVEVGVWECSPGRFSSVRDAGSEICHLISGKVTLHNQDGSTQDCGPGDAFVLPLGWRGEWTIHTLTRKLYIMHYKG